MKLEIPYSSDKFDENYYGKKGGNGFGEEVYWESAIQQVELHTKFCYLSDEEYKTILFVGCAFGNEVRFFRNHHKIATGVDISEYAISVADESIKEYVKLYNGWELADYADDSVEVIASFDVLTLIPDDMLEKLVMEMCRVANKIIIIRTGVDRNNVYKGDWVGNDGVTFRYLTLDKWEELFAKGHFFNKYFFTQVRKLNRREEEAEEFVIKFYKE